MQTSRKVVLQQANISQGPLRGALDPEEAQDGPALILDASLSTPGFVLGSGLHYPQVEAWLISSASPILTVPSEYIFLVTKARSRHGDLFFLLVAPSSSLFPSPHSERDLKILLKWFYGGGHLYLLLLLWETFHRAEYRKLSFQTYHSV